MMRCQAWVFRKSALGVWDSGTKLAATGAAAGAWAGNAVAISGDGATVAIGGAYVRT